MDSCDSAGRKNKTDGFSECFGENRICLLKPPVYMPIQ